PALYDRDDLRAHVSDDSFADRRLPLVSDPHLNPADRPKICGASFWTRISQPCRQRRPGGIAEMIEAKTMTETPRKPVILARDVRKSFGANEVLKGVSLSIQASEVVVILGSSGSGKSTFLRCLNQLEDINGGWIEID